MNRSRVGMEDAAMAAFLPLRTSVSNASLLRESASIVWMRLGSR